MWNRALGALAHLTPLVNVPKRDPSFSRIQAEPHLQVSENETPHTRAALGGIWSPEPTHEDHQVTRYARVLGRLGLGEGNDRAPILGGSTRADSLGKSGLENHGCLWVHLLDDEGCCPCSCQRQRAIIDCR